MKYLLFGTGDYYERYKKWFEEEEVLALVDNSPQKQNTLIDGITVLSPEEGVRLTFDVIVILSFYVKAMKRQLMELNVPEEKIYHFYDLHKLIYKKEIKKPAAYYGNAEEIVLSDDPLKNKVLLLSQDLTLGGPAIALLHAAEILARHGYQVVYASMIDGPLREKLLEMNIAVIVDVNLQIETMREADWTSGFSMILCNTINFHVFLSERNLRIPVLWWLHDSSFFYDGIAPGVLRKIDRTNMQICSVGHVPADAMKSFVPDISTERLLYGVQDTRRNIKKRTERRSAVRFVTIGYVEERKGQDILMRALLTLPEAIRNRAVFYLVGQDSSALAQKIRLEIEKIPQCIMIGPVSRRQIHEILSGADVLICPSREDPMPTVAAEAMMHGIPCIISDAAGTAEYLQDGKNGFVFGSGNIDELSLKIRRCIERPEELPVIGKRARDLYERYFSMDVFEKDLLRIWEHVRREQAFTVKDEKEVEICPT